MTQNEHVYAICCRPKVVGDIISGENVRTLDCYPLLNFEVARFNSFRDIQKKSHFLTAASDAAAEADIDDSIRQNRVRVSLKNNGVATNSCLPESQMTKIMRLS